MAVQRTLRMSAQQLAAERLAGSDEDVHFTRSFAAIVIREFSAPGDVVLDPFAGFGTTLEVSEELGRSAVGVEVLPERVVLIGQRLAGRGRIVQGDARRLSELRLPAAQLCLTSPPYMGAYDDPDNPLTGYTTEDGYYPRYLDELAAVFHDVAGLLRPGGHLVVNAANIRTDGVVTPLAWDIAARLAGEYLLREVTHLEWDDAPDWMEGDYCLVFSPR